jgi:hypothetical protein
MSADWNLPTTASLYDTAVLQVLKNRDFDAISLCLADPSNMIDGMLKLVRSPKIKIQERASGAWADRILDIEGGGTGANTAGNARTALGLGTMATQNSGAVSISGGTLAGNGAGLTSLTAANITSGGTLPALNGSNLTALNGAAIATGQIPVARMGTGAASSSKVLLGDGTWGDYNVYLASKRDTVSFGSTEVSHVFDITVLGVTNIKEVVVECGGPFFVVDSSGYTWQLSWQVTSTTQITFYRTVYANGNPGGAVDLGVSTHYVFAARIRVP